MSIRYGIARAASRPVAPSVAMSSDGRSAASITVGGRTWGCSDTSIFRLQIWTTGMALHATTTLSPADFAVTTTTDADGVVTITATKSHLSGVITFVGTITPDSDAQIIRTSCRITNTAQCAVAIVEFPRLAIKPQSQPDNTYTFWGFGEGTVRRSQYLDALYVYPIAPGMNCLGIYDSTTRGQLYMERRFVDETVMPYMVVQAEGQEADDETATYDIAHIPQHGRTYQNSYDQSDWYTWEISAIQGVGDGRSGFQETCDRYAEYALESDASGFKRRWVPADRWWESTEFSSRVSGARVWTRTGDTTAGVSGGTTTPDYTFYGTEFTRLKANIGAASNTILQGPQFWHANQFDRTLPSHTPQRGSPAFTNYIGTIHAAGGYTVPYVIPSNWLSTSLAGTYNISSYLSVLGAPNYGDMRTGMIQDTTGAPVVVPGTENNYQFDFSFWSALIDESASGYTFGSNGATTSSIIGDLMLRYSVDMSNLTDVFYVDVGGGLDGYLYQNFGPTAPFGGGNHGKGTYGKIKVWQFVRGTAKFLFTNALGLITETFEEACLIPFEAVNMYDTFDTSLAGGCSCAAARRIYGDYQRFYSFSPQVTSQDIANANAYIQACVTNWFRTGMISFIADTSPAKTVVFDGNTDYTTPLVKLGAFALAMRVMYASLTYTEPYVVKGKLLRPMTTSFELDALDNRENLYDYTSVSIIENQNTSQLPHGVYKHYQNETWGIVCFNHLVASGPFRIVLEARDYGMPPGEKILYQTSVSTGVRTELTRFRHAVDYTASVPTGGSAVVGLFEIVPV